MDVKLERTVKATVKLEGKEVDDLIQILTRHRGSTAVMDFADKLARELQEGEFDEDEED